MSIAIVPIPQVDVSVREGTADDFAFVDALQKTHSKQLGFLKRMALQGKFDAGQVLIAEGVDRCELRVGSGDGGSPVLATNNSQLPTARLGYIIAQDRYFKRDDVGIVFQLNVVPGRQRGFVGATLLKAAFDRAAYGCRLFCCWCAQDIAANRFWEAMGFVPLAFRAGSEKKGRVHIFWQKRIRAGDEATPWWFPCQTNAGMLGEDRLVLPIPPGKHWADEMPVILGEPRENEAPKQLAAPATVRVVKKIAPAPARPTISRATSLRAVPVVPITPPAATSAKKPVARTKRKNDPKLIAAARELRDRWLEQVNSGGAGAYVLEDRAKYAVCRAIESHHPAAAVRALAGTRVKQLRHVA